MNIKKPPMRSLQNLRYKQAGNHCRQKGRQKHKPSGNHPQQDQHQCIQNQNNHCRIFKQPSRQ